MAASVHEARLYNEDLAPAEERRWKGFDLFAMWMSDVHSIGGYTFAAGLFYLGIVAWQVFLALVIGGLIIFVGLLAAGFAGQKHGVPYPVISRISFGVFGANIPALIRGIAAIFWYGIQTYLASVAVEVLLLAIWPGLHGFANSSFLQLSGLGWVCFIVIWLLQFAVFSRGMEAIRRFTDFAGPVVWVVMLVLMVWLLVVAGGRLVLQTHELPFGKGMLEFWSAVSLVVAYFSTLLLNFCDFSRFAPNRRSVVVGSFLGIPINFTAFSAVSVVVTACTITVFGHAIFDPVEIVAQVPNAALLVIGALLFMVATIGINIVANFVSPAYDISNVAPSHISFRQGGIIAAVLSVFVMPWIVYANPAAVNYFLGGLGAFLGPLFGVIFCDYYIIRRKLSVKTEDLFKAGEGAPYWYRGGFNPQALYAFIPSAVVTSIFALVPYFGAVAPFSWPLGVLLAGALYWTIVRAGWGAEAADRRLDLVEAGVSGA